MLGALQAWERLENWSNEFKSSIRTILEVGGLIEELPETDFILREESSELYVLAILLVRREVTRRSECGMNSVV